MSETLPRDLDAAVIFFKPLANVTSARPRRVPSPAAAGMRHRTCK
jgi:hypothetical protein